MIQIQKHQIRLEPWRDLTDPALPAFHDRRMRLLTGVVREVSADSFVDEKTGAVRVHIERPMP